MNGVQRDFVAFLAPVSVFMALGLVVPLAYVAYQSLQGDGLSLDAYRELLESRLFAIVIRTTAEISLAATLISVALGYPIALHLSRVSQRWQAVLFMLVLLPFWTSILVKSYSFIVILGEDGLINHALAAAGLPRLPLIFNRVGVLIGMTNFLVPFIVFPLLANLLAQNPDLRSAAAIMGASDSRIFWRITFPLSLPGLMAGTITSFVISLGFFVTPALLGGRTDTMVANLIDFYARESLEWPLASAIAVVLLAAISLLLLIMARLRSRDALI